MRHSRESGNPVLDTSVRWYDTSFAGMTQRAASFPLIIPIIYMMRNIILTLLTIIILISAFSCSYANYPYDYKVKELYSEPDGRSKIVYQIPIDVRMLDVSEDANWYRVSIKFSLGIVELKYSGWAYIPVGNILAERTGKSNLANSSK